MATTTTETDNPLYALGYTSSDVERIERARRATVRAKKLLPQWQSFARMMTRNPKLRMELTSGVPRTNGETIWCRVPIELGDDLDHVRPLCGERDPATLDQKCPMCSLFESVNVDVYHEVSHITEDSFVDMDEWEKVEALREAINLEANGQPDSTRAAKLKAKFDAYNPSNFVQAAGLTSQWLARVFNSIEDGRVNKAMTTKRPGTKKMFAAQTNKIFEQGVVTMAGEHKTWKDMPVNMQAIIAVYCKVSDLDYSTWLDPEVVANLDDLELNAMCKTAQNARSAKTVYRQSLPVLERLRKLGYCKTPDDPEDDPKPEPEPQPEPAPQKESKPKEESDEDPSEGEESEGPTPDESDASESSDDDDESGEDGDDAGQDEAASDGDDDPGEGASGDGDDEDDESESDSDPGSDAEGSPDGEPEDGDQDADGSGDATDATDDDNAPSGGGGDTPEPSTSPQNGNKDPEDGQSDGSASDGDDQDESHEDDLDTSEQDGTGDGGDLDDEEDWDGTNPTFGGSDTDLTEEEQADQPEPYTDEDLERDGTPEEVDHGFQVFGRHDDDGHVQDSSTDADKEEIDRAIVQGDHFDTPSRNVYGVQIHHHDDEDPGESWSRGYYGRRNQTERLSVPEAILNPALTKLRIIFADNKRGKHMRNLEKGRVDARNLGRRLPVGDPRMFHKKIQPGKKDYFVLIGLDVSGSTCRTGLLELIKTAAYAKAELMNRLGVKFAVYAHTGVASEKGYPSMDLDIYEIKGPNDPWNDKAKSALNGLGSASANLDGHTLEFYRKVTERESATDKLILYYTDGAMPAENFREELELLQRNIKLCERRGIKIVGIGIKNDDPAEHGLDTIRLDRIEDVPKVVTELEKRLSR